MLTSQLSKQFEQLAQEFSGELHLDSLTRRIFATDASVYEQLPAAVAFPKDERDIAALIRLARSLKTGLIPRTAGTSLAGQVVGDGIVVDVSRHFTDILEVNEEQGWVRVQPGVIRNELNMALAEYGLMFGPETSTANRAMIGGMLGNNSCGSNSIVYGTMREQTLEVTGFLSDGSRITLGPLDAAAYQAKQDANEDTLESRIYRGLHERLSNPTNRQEIQKQFPKPEVTRRNTGYALDRLLQQQPFSIRR